MAREGFSHPGAVATAKVHVKVKVIETNGKQKPRRNVKKIYVYAAYSGKIRKQTNKILHCYLDKIRSKQVRQKHSQINPMSQCNSGYSPMSYRLPVPRSEQ